MEKERKAILIIHIGEDRKYNINIFFLKKSTKENTFTFSIIHVSKKMKHFEQTIFKQMKHTPIHKHVKIPRTNIHQ